LQNKFGYQFVYLKLKVSTTYIDIVLEGDKFSPRMLKELTNFDIETLAEYGEVGLKGRYKGKKMPYGLALLKVAPAYSEDINLALQKVIDGLLLEKPALEESGVDEITLDLENFSQSEIEITINKEIIKKISALSASIDISSSNFHSEPAKRAIRKTDKGGLAVAKKGAVRLARGTFNFSRREMEVLSLIKDGLTTREIAKTLSIEEYSIEGMRRSMIKKSGARNMIVVIYAAQSYGLI